MRPEAALLSRSARWDALARLAPAYAVHLTVRPFRRDLDTPPAGAGFGARHSAAALDAWFGMVVRAYGRLAGIRLRRASGPLAIRYVRVASALNREFEHRLATGGSLAFPQLCAAPLVGSAVAEWRRAATAAGADTDVVDFLASAEVADDYDRYVEVTTREGFADDPELQMESIRLDSGGYLARLVRLVGSLNGGAAAPELLAQFHDLGIAAKLTDELTDFLADHAEGRYNLLLALLGQEPAERAAVLSRPDGGAWEWAPVTFARFTRLYREYHGRLTAPDLRRACDATMARALAGSKRKRHAPSQHVSEPPQQAWR